MGKRITLLMLCTGPNPIETITSIKLYACFKQSDWLLKMFQPIRMLKIKLA